LLNQAVVKTTKEGPSSANVLIYVALNSLSNADVPQNSYAVILPW